MIQKLDLRIGDPVPMFKKGRQVADDQIAILIEGGSDHSSAVFAIPGGIIRATPKKGYAKWCATDNHRLEFPENEWRQSLVVVEKSARLSGVPISIKPPETS